MYEQHMERREALTQTELETMYDRYSETAQPPNAKPAQLFEKLHSALEEYINEIQKNAWIAGYQAGAERDKT